MQHFVEGWTTPIDYQLKKNEAAFNATGMTVALELRDGNGDVIEESGVTDWLDPVQSTVRYTPDAADLTNARSPISVRWRVTSGSQKGWFPRSRPEIWEIGLP